MDINAPAPGQQLYLRVRAGFIVQGKTLSAWCRQRGVAQTNAKHALIGSWNGPKGRALRDELVAASGIANPPAV